ncbi:GntR family transcriptional regulator [uncultured Martelella sp.]|uniref:GntR family transcriptional regulator n=1 Tax=uncultured Martelella sp. TaxID=392331 RepID=UPI0029C75D71|nr:GntR family transcriptional regulator [uncultured Martelella sp.]
MTAKSKTASRICAEIEQRIAMGRYQDGEKLNEVALATELNVSRTPLREAFQILNASFLVELIPNRGAFVRRPSMVRLVEMFEVMAELEAWCVKLATRRITPAQRLFLREAAQGCEKALKQERPDLYYKANNRLHGMFYEASGNSVLAEEAGRMHQRLRPFRRHQLDVKGRLAKSMREHAEILEAMDNGDAELAAERMRRHINTLGATYDEYISTLEAMSQAGAGD